MLTTRRATVRVGAGLLIHRSRRWSVDTPKGEERPDGEDWEALIKCEIEAAEKGELCEARGADAVPAAGTAVPASRPADSLQPPDAFKELHSDLKELRQEATRQAKTLRDLSQMLTKLSAASETAAPSTNISEEERQTQRELEKDAAEVIRVVDTEYREELASLKKKYEADQARLKAEIQGSANTANMEVIADVYSRQSEQLRRDYKEDLMRLSRNHNLSVTEVQQAVDTSNRLLKDVISKQHTRNLMSGVTIGLLFFLLGISLVVNYVQFVFIRTTGTQYIFSTAVRYLHSRPALDDRNPEEVRQRRHMEIMMGLT